VLPMPAAEIADGQPLTALTRLCWVGGKADAFTGTVHRHVERSTGALVERFGELPVDLGSGSKVRCRDLVDRVTTETLAAGEYRFRVGADGEGWPSGRAAHDFSVLGAESDQRPANRSPSSKTNRSSSTRTSCK